MVAAVYLGVGTRMKMPLVLFQYTNMKGIADDCVDMRKPMKRDKLKMSIRENGENFLVTPDEVIF